MMFQRNMCTIDRVLRILVGIGLLYVGFIAPELVGINNVLLGTLLGVVGFLNIGSAFMGHCPAYTVAGLSTCKKSDDNEE